MPGAVQRFLPLLDQVAGDFSRMLRARVERGARRSLTLDPSPDLFRFALEGPHAFLYIHVCVCVCVCVCVLGELNTCVCLCAWMC